MLICKEAKINGLARDRTGDLAFTTPRLDQLSWLAHVFEKRSEWILDRRRSLMVQITRQASSSSF